MRCPREPGDVPGLADLLDETGLAERSPRHLPGHRGDEAGVVALGADPATAHERNEHDEGSMASRPPTARGHPRGRKSAAAPTRPATRRGMGTTHHIRHTTEVRPIPSRIPRTGGSSITPAAASDPMAAVRSPRLAKAEDAEAQGGRRRRRCRGAPAPSSTGPRLGWPPGTNPSTSSWAFVGEGVANARVASPAMIGYTTHRSGRTAPRISRRASAASTSPPTRTGTRKTAVLDIPTATWGGAEEQVRSGTPATDQLDTEQDQPAG